MNNPRWIARSFFVVFFSGAVLLGACGRAEEPGSEVATVTAVPRRDSGSVAATGPSFASWYAANYASVKAKVGFTYNGCAAFVTTALRSFGVDIGYDAWAPNVPAKLQRLGWTKVTNASALAAGDVVFTRDAQTARDGLTPHVFVFKGYSGSQAVAIDNQGNGYVRNLSANGPKSWFWFAYRAPGGQAPAASSDFGQERAPRDEGSEETLESNAPSASSSTHAPSASSSTYAPYQGGGSCNQAALDACLRSQDVQVCYARQPGC